MGVSTVISFDIYKQYSKPRATDAQLLKASHWAVVGFSIFMAGFASALHGGKVDLGAPTLEPSLWPAPWTELKSTKPLQAFSTILQASLRTFSSLSLSPRLTSLTIGKEKFRRGPGLPPLVATFFSDRPGSVSAVLSIWRE